MTPSEVVVLARYVKACCPQQAIDEFTPDAWHDLLGDLRLEDCRSAVADIAKLQPFVGPSEIRSRVKEVRQERLDRTPVPPAPPHIAGNGDAYREWHGTWRKRIADGDWTGPQIEGGTVRAIEGGRR